MDASVSVVIPSLSGDVDRAVASVLSQTVAVHEVKVVAGLRPAARARNVGVAETTGELILFLDDDAELGHPRVLEEVLRAERQWSPAFVGTSKILPPRSSRFQKRVAREVPRWIFPVLDADAEVPPPLDRYGFAPVTTTCCLVRRGVLETIGGFDEKLPTGEDTEWFYRALRGIPVVLFTGVSIVHVGGMSTRQQPRRMTLLFVESTYLAYAVALAAGGLVTSGDITILGSAFGSRGVAMTRRLGHLVDMIFVRSWGRT